MINVYDSYSAVFCQQLASQNTENKTTESDQS